MRAHRPEEGLDDLLVRASRATGRAAGGIGGSRDDVQRVAQRGSEKKREAWPEHEPGFGVGERERQHPARPWESVRAGAAGAWGWERGASCERIRGQYPAPIAAFAKLAVDPSRPTLPLPTFPALPPASKDSFTLGAPRLGKFMGAPRRSSCRVTRLHLTCCFKLLAAGHTAGCDLHAARRGYGECRCSARERSLGSHSTGPGHLSPASRASQHPSSASRNYCSRKSSKLLHDYFRNLVLVLLPGYYSCSIR